MFGDVLDELVDRIEADDRGWVDGLEAVVLEFGCDETEEVSALPFLVGVPEFSPVALPDVEAEKLLDVAGNRSQLGRLQLGVVAFRFLWHGGVLSEINKQVEYTERAAQAPISSKLSIAFQSATFSMVVTNWEMVCSSTLSEPAVNHSTKWR